jgi:hypothetical protein
MMTPAQLVAGLDNHPFNLPPVSGTRQTTAYLILGHLTEQNIALPSDTPNAVEQLVGWMKEGFYPIGYHFLYVQLVAASGTLAYSSRMELFDEHKGTWAEEWFHEYDRRMLAWMWANSPDIATAVA